MTLREIIVQEIRERGPIAFSRYMELCLYHPELGYYSRNLEQFGKAGDFYTASDVHALYGRILSRQFEEIWRRMGQPEQIEILELGPGRGLFAQDVLDWTKKRFPAFFHLMRYSLLETSAALRARLEATLASHIAAGKASILPARQSADSPVATSVARGLGREVPLIIFANEFFDALPVEIVSRQGQLQVGVQDDRFVELWTKSSEDVMRFLDLYSVHPEEGERIEVPLAAQEYISACADLAETSVLLTVDYGYTREELLAGSHRGTLMTYRRHSSGSNPYEAPGEQDITAHVNFAALAAAAEERGMQVQPLVTQSHFLLGIGEENQFADAFEECRFPQERAKVALHLKHLITPEGMGEAFRVMAASKGIAAEKVASLSGLSFGKVDRTG